MLLDFFKSYYKLYRENKIFYRNSLIFSLLKGILLVEHDYFQNELLEELFKEYINLYSFIIKIVSINNVNFRSLTKTPCMLSKLRIFSTKIKVLNLEDCCEYLKVLELIDNPLLDFSIEEPLLNLTKLTLITTPVKGILRLSEKITEIYIEGTLVEGITGKGKSLKKVSIKRNKMIKTLECFKYSEILDTLTLENNQNLVFLGNILKVRKFIVMYCKKLTTIHFLNLEGITCFKVVENSSLKSFRTRGKFEKLLEAVIHGTNFEESLEHLVKKVLSSYNVNLINIKNVELSRLIVNITNYNLRELKIVNCNLKIIKRIRIYTNSIICIRNKNENFFYSSELLFKLRRYNLQEQTLKKILLRRVLSNLIRRTYRKNYCVENIQGSLDNWLYNPRRKNFINYLVFKKNFK